MNEEHADVSAKDAPVALLVRATDASLSNEYGVVVKRAVLRAVLAADESRSHQFQTFWGTLILPGLRYSGATTHPVCETVMAHDPFLFWSCAYKLHRSCQGRWNTLGTDAPWLIGTAPIYVGVLSHLPRQIFERLDRNLRREPWYVGATEVDTDSPLHRKVFSLIPGWRYACGAVDQQGEGAIPAQELFKGIDVAGFNLDTRLIPEDSCAITWTVPEEETEQPVTFAALATQDGATYQERIVAEIAHRYERDERVLTFATGRRQPLVDELRGKLHDYVLNPDHPRGKDKARVFKSALGIEQKHWKLLAIQLISSLQSSLPVRFRDEPPWGERQQLRFETEVELIGLNGKRSRFTASWKIEDDEPAQLTTIKPGKKVSGVADVLAVTTGYWASLYGLAQAVAERAMRDCRPTPIAVKGVSRVDVVPEGLAGYAWVQFPDARTGLVRWLLEAEHATRSHPGAFIMAPTHFLDPAVAWAEAMATVFRDAGHECSVSQELD